MSTCWKPFTRAELRCLWRAGTGELRPGAILLHRALALRVQGPGSIHHPDVRAHAACGSGPRVRPPAPRVSRQGRQVRCALRPCVCPFRFLPLKLLFLILLLQSPIVKSKESFSPLPLPFWPHPPRDGRAGPAEPQLRRSGVHVSMGCTGLLAASATPRSSFYRGSWRATRRCARPSTCWAARGP
jgi:hypothetical protein